MKVGMVAATLALPMQAQAVEPVRLCKGDKCAEGDGTEAALILLAMLGVVIATAPGGLFATRDGAQVMTVPQGDDGDLGFVIEE